MLSHSAHKYLNVIILEPRTFIPVYHVLSYRLACFIYIAYLKNTKKCNIVSHFSQNHVTFKIHIFIFLSRLIAKIKAVVNNF